MSNERVNQKKRAPSPRGHFLLGEMEAFRTDALALTRSLQKEFGDVARFRLGPFSVFQLSHPDGIKRVLQDNNKNYDKNTPNYKTLRPNLGNGLLTAEGESWASQRRIAQPAFHRERVASFATPMTGAAQAAVERWNGLTADVPIDMAREMQRITMRIASDTLFSLDIGDDAQAFAEAVDETLKWAIVQLTSLLPLPPFVPTSMNRRFNRASKIISGIVSKIVAQRRKDPTDRGDLLSMLMLTRDAETGATMNDALLHDEVVTLLGAGYETSANALTWAYFLLAQHPDVWEMLQDELRTVLGGRLPTFADLPKLTFTKMVIDETMRLYPPVWLITRGAVAEDEIGGYTIPKRSILFANAYLAHRHPEFWNNPDAFDPTRFEPSRAAAIAKYAYFPFGGGPRMCIGNQFAIMETQLVLATLAQAYRAEIAPGFVTTPEAIITLRPKHGIQMILKPVKRNARLAASA